MAVWSQAPLSWVSQLACSTGRAAVRRAGPVRSHQIGLRDSREGAAAALCQVGLGEGQPHWVAMALRCNMRGDHDWLGWVQELMRMCDQDCLRTAHMFSRKERNRLLGEHRGAYC